MEFEDRFRKGRRAQSNACLIHQSSREISGYRHFELMIWIMFTKNIQEIYPLALFLICVSRIVNPRVKS